MRLSATNGANRMAAFHISDDDLERYWLHMVPDGPEIDLIQKHLLECQQCLDRAREARDYVKAMKAACTKLRSVK